MMDGHNCSQICVELEGSFNCSCYSGYELQNDGATCEGNCTYLHNIHSYISKIEVCNILSCKPGATRCCHDYKQCY